MMEKDMNVENDGVNLSKHHAESYLESLQWLYSAWLIYSIALYLLSSTMIVPQAGNLFKNYNMHEMQQDMVLVPATVHCST